MDFRALDLDTFATILGLAIDDCRDFVEPLTYFTGLLKQIRVSENHVLPPPNTQFTEQTISITFPMIVHKVLAMHALDTRGDSAVRAFLSEGLALIAFWTTTFCSEQFLPLIVDIFDPAQVFYLHNGRDTDQPYSRHLYGLATEFATTGMSVSLLSMIDRDSVSEADVVRVIDIFQRIAAVVGSPMAISDDNFASQVFVHVIERFSQSEDPRKLKWKELLKILPGIGTLIKTDDILSAVKAAMMTFLFDIDLADVKIAGMRMCYILFTDLLVVVQDDDLSLLTCVIGQVNSLEGLNILKPILVKLGERNQMTVEIMSTLWTTVNAQFSTVLQKCLTVFCDVALACKQMPEIMEIVSDPVRLEVFRQLIKGKQFEDAASKKLLDMGTPEAFQELVKAAKDTDLAVIVPDVCSKIENPDMVVDCLFLLSAIFTKSPQDFDTTAIMQTIVDNYDKFVDVGHIAESIANLLMKTSTQLKRAVFEKLYVKSGDDCSKFIVPLFPSGRSPFVDEESLGFLADAIRTDEITDSRFLVLKHLYLNLDTKYENVHSAIRDSLWNLVLVPPSPKLGRDASSLLLVGCSNEMAPIMLTQYVRRCLDELLQSENVNAATFINECLGKAAEYIEIEALGVRSHRLEVPDDCLDLKVRFEGEVIPVSFDRGAQVSRLLTRIACMVSRDPCSIVLYYNNSSLKPAMIIGDHFKAGDVIEVRCRSVYDRSPVFTKENHPAFVCNSEKYAGRLLALLDSGIANVVYDILLQVPTLYSFNLDNLRDLDPSKKFLFMYQLHYLANHFEERDDKAQVQAAMEELLVTKFSTTEPEARFLLVYMLDSNTKNPELLTVVLCGLCKEPRCRSFTRTIRRLWAIVGNFDMTLTLEDLRLLLSNPSPKFRELALGSELIRRQPFDVVWGAYCELGDKLENIDVLSTVTVPEDKYQLVFETLVPYFSSLNEKLLDVFEQITRNWADFPFEQIVPTLLENYIYCKSKPASITEAPFKLLISVMERSEEIRANVLNIISETIPDTTKWNYVPEDCFKQIRCGLTNLGATCYINSVSQQLFNIPQIRDFFVAISSDYQPLQAYHKLFTHLQFSSRKAIDMQWFANEWTGWGEEKLDPKAQQDAIEFLTLLLSRMEMYPGVLDLVTGETVSERVGSDGKYRGDAETERFNALPLVVMDQHCIADSLKVMSLPEVISDYRPEGYTSPIDLHCTTKITKLPPYLIVQLKRFDYSIETGMKIKLDQEYNFEESFDFKPYFHGPEQETRYNLSGVVVHQGDAEVGHYFSYIKAGPDQWMCLNDQSVQIVSTAVMRNDAKGSPEGSTAYLLFYERLDARDVKLEIPKIEDVALVDSIKADNMRLVIDTVYFSKPFARFIIDVLKKFGDSSAPLEYFIKCLSHSSLVDYFKELADVIAAERLSAFQEYLTANSNCIPQIMSECSNKGVRMQFSELIKQVFANMDIDNDLIIIIMSQIWDWAPKILENWRNSFDFFKIFFDYASLSQGHVDMLNGLELGGCLLTFVNVNVRDFVANKENKVTAERFCRLCDMTYLLKCFMILDVDPATLLSKQCLKWFVGSESHAAVLIEMILHFKPDALRSFDKVIDQTETKPSEFIIAELVKYDTFRCPAAWLTKYFSDTPKQRHLLQALSDVFTKDPSLFSKFWQNQEDIVSFLLFSQNLEIRNETVGEIQRMASKVPDIDRLLFPVVKVVYSLSKVLYSNKDYAFNVLPLDFFVALPFLQFLVEYSVKCPSLPDYLPVVSQTLESVLSLKAKRDEHAILLAQIMCQMMKVSELPSTSIVLIQLAIATMYPDHKQLDSTLRNYFIGLANQKRATADVYVPDNAMKDVIFRCFLTSEATFATSSKECLTLITSIGSRYAAATRILKALPGYVLDPHCVDVKRLVQTIAKFDKGAIRQNAPVLANNPEVLAKLFSCGRSLRAGDPQLSSVLEFFRALLSAKPDSVVSKDPLVLRPFVDLLCEESLVEANRELVIGLIYPSITLIEDDDALREACGDNILCLFGPIAFCVDYTNDLLDRMARCPTTDFFQKKAAAEMEATILKAANLESLQKVQVALRNLFSSSQSIEGFVECACSVPVLVKLLSLATSVDDIEGYKFMFCRAPIEVVDEVLVNQPPEIVSFVRELQGQTEEKNVSDFASS